MDQKKRMRLRLSHYKTGSSNGRNTKSPHNTRWTLIWSSQKLTGEIKDDQKSQLDPFSSSHYNCSLPLLQLEGNRCNCQLKGCTHNIIHLWYVPFTVSAGLLWSGHMHCPLSTYGGVHHYHYLFESLICHSAWNV